MPALKRINSNVDVPSYKLAGREGGGHAKTSPPIDVPQHMLDYVRSKVRVRASDYPSVPVPDASQDVDLFDFEVTENQDCSLSSASAGGQPSSPTQLAHMVGRLQALSSPSATMEIEVARHVRWVVESQDESGLAPSAAGVCETVAASLAGGGFSAQMVQSKSDSSDYLRSMNHLFVLVHPRGGVLEQQPLVVDPNFRTQFQIARPTPEYERLLAVLPHEFVGTRDRLAEVVEFMSKRLHESFKVRDLACPPWRERQAMLSKWFGGLQSTAGSGHGKQSPPGLPGGGGWGGSGQRAVGQVAA